MKPPFKPGDWIRTNPDNNWDKNFWIFQVYKVEKDGLWSIISVNFTNDYLNTDMGYLNYSDYPKSRLATSDEIKLVKELLVQRSNEVKAVNLLLLSGTLIYHEI